MVEIHTRITMKSKFNRLTNGRVVERKLRQTVNLVPSGYDGSNPSSPTNGAQPRFCVLCAFQENTTEPCGEMRR